MAFEDRSYSGNAVPTTLTANISNVATSIPIAASTGWPDGTGGPFHVGISPTEDPHDVTEVIRCSGRTGLTLNVQTTPVTGRGWDGTTALAHLVGAYVFHVFTATDADEANQHIVNTGLDHHTQYLTVVRHDTASRHGIGSLPVGGTPSTSSVGNTSQVGTSNTLARSDHRHARENFGAVTAAGPTNVDGTATTISRSDHIHAGGVPILTSGTRPTTGLVTGQTIIESDTRRLISRSPSAWVRSAPLTSAGRTGVIVGRSAAMNVNDGGATGTPIPWDTETFDSDNFITVNGTTSTTITPTGDATGIYLATVYGQWGAIFSGRSFVEILFDGLYNYRVTTTGEDRFTITAMLDCNGQSVQVTAWQNSGVMQTVTFAFMSMYRIQP